MANTIGTQPLRACPMIRLVSMVRCHCPLKMCIRDRCNGTSNTGYYVAVLNCWFCPKCYNEWYGCATHYPEDIKTVSYTHLQKEMLDMPSSTHPDKTFSFAIVSEMWDVITLAYYSESNTPVTVQTNK